MWCFGRGRAISRCSRATTGTRHRSVQWSGACWRRRVQPGRSERRARRDRLEPQGLPERRDRVGRPDRRALPGLQGQAGWCTRGTTFDAELCAGRCSALAGHELYLADREQPREYTQRESTAVGRGGGAGCGRAYRCDRRDGAGRASGTTGDDGSSRTDGAGGAAGNCGVGRSAGAARCDGSGRGQRAAGSAGNRGTGWSAGNSWSDGSDRPQRTDGAAGSRRAGGDDVPGGVLVDHELCTGGWSYVQRRWVCIVGCEQPWEYA